MTFSIDPRRSLAAGALWLIVALAAAFSCAAGLWVGRIARDNVIEQHVRRLQLETDQLSSDLGQSLASHFGAVRAAGILTQGAEPRAALGAVFEELRSAYPELDWIAVAAADGRIVGVRAAGEPPPDAAYRGAIRRGLEPGESVAGRDWFEVGLRQAWLGVMELPSRGGDPGLGDVAIPIRDRGGAVLGVAAAHLPRPAVHDPPLRLTDESGPNGAARAVVLDRRRIVLIGPREWRGKPWPGTARIDARVAGTAHDAALLDKSPHFERLPHGEEVLVSGAAIETGSSAEAGWQVLLREPLERVYQRANALALSILQVSLCLGALTSILGGVGALQLTRRLQRLTRSVEDAGRDEEARIEVPPGRDEVARLAGAFDLVHADLKRERQELRALSSELERRVEVRTREVKRLAEESRYAAIVRERLKIARDLHDTLAHSMMAMLSEIRFLRKIQARDPDALPKELAHAEEVAHQGLKEARSAIAQMRAGTVRETGLGPALAALFDRFIDRTGLAGEFQSDSEAARFGDERAEMLLRMAQEGLRNIERHARATRIDLTLRTSSDHRLELRLEDNGVGFDAAAATPGHFGLVGLGEQAELIGAELTIDSRPGNGTRICVTVRLSPIEFVQPTTVGGVEAT